MIAFLLGLAGPLLRLFSPTSKLFHLLGKLSDNPVEMERIRAEAATKLIEARASVIQTGMQSKVFWVPWLMAAVPTSAWFGWGMVDSLANGALPDVAALPPQLREYADIVFQNIFLTGAGAVGVQSIASALRRK
jgi:hypothetical protein